MNKVVLVGRLTKDPEIRITPGNGTAVTTINIAVDKYSNGEKSADFINVTIWGKQAEATANYMTKGGLIGIVGRIQTRSYEAQDGTKRYVTEVVANEVQFLGKGKSQQDNNQSFDEGMEGMTPVDSSDIPF